MCFVLIRFSSVEENILKKDELKVQKYYTKRILSTEMLEKKNGWYDESLFRMAIMMRSERYKILMIGMRKWQVIGVYY